MPLSCLLRVRGEKSLKYRRGGERLSGIGGYVYIK